MINPLDELKKLNSEIEQAADLATLKPLYYRLQEIAKNYPDDFDVFFAVNETRQLLIARGAALQQPTAPPSAPVTPPVIPPSPVAPVPEVAAPAAPSAPEPTSPPLIEEPAPAPPQFSLFDESPPLRPEQTTTQMPDVVPATDLFDFADSPPPPPPISPTLVNTPPASAPPPTLLPEPARPAAAPAHAGPNRKPLVLIGSIAAVVIAVGLGALLVQKNRRPGAGGAVGAGVVQVDVATVPAGASVRVAPVQGVPGGSGETTCTSNCKLSLSPGDYQVTASLSGFEPAAGSVHVAAGRPAQMSLPLQPQAQSVRLLTDLEQGKVVLDDQAPADIQEGQLVLDKLSPGSHNVKITGRNGDAAFAFDIVDARLPVLTAPVTAHNLIAVVVASFGGVAHVVTSAGPLKLNVNGQPQGDLGPAGKDLTNFQPGVNEMVVGEGRDQRNMSENFGAAPMITVFLKSDVSTGTLIISAGQDDVRVFLNDKEYRRRTQRGQLRIQTLGKVTVRVSKSGFLDEAAQTAEVKKGEEVRLQFALKPQPQFGSLQLRGSTPGAEIFLDQKSIGVVAPDGTFSFKTVQPGERTIELRHAQYAPKRLQRTIQAGQTVVLAGADVVMVSTRGTIHVNRNPPGAVVTYRRADETESHEMPGNQVELTAGSYVFTATAQGFSEATAQVQLAAGENRPVELTLARERPAPTVPAPVVARGMSDFEDQQGWKQEGDVWTHKGGGFVPFKLPDKGVFTFTVQLLKGGGVFRAGKIRWCVLYIDSKNYLLTEMDRKTFWTGVIEKGSRLERTKAPHHLENQKAFTVQIEVSPEQLVQKVQVGNQWTVLDTFVEAGRDFTKGKFGFLIQGNDEIAISDFKFVAK